MGAWIETTATIVPMLLMLSHPVWVRGLKPTLGFDGFVKRQVAPRVGAWIETFGVPLAERSAMVAPRVGAWIET